MEYIKKNWSNILFIGFVIFLFTPYGLPVRATLIKGVSLVTTRVFSMENDPEDQVLVEDMDWNLKERNGGSVNLKDFEGQVVFVNIWATWCPPCVAEMPSLQSLFDSYGDKVVFLFVANDDSSKVENFLKKKNYDLPVYYQLAPGPKEMRSNSLPTTYILDKNGKIIVDKTGAADWNSSKVRNLLDKLLAK